MDFPSLLMLLTLPVLLVASAFFSGSETALFSLTRHQRASFERSTGVVGRAIATLLHETRSLLITLLLGNMTVNVTYFVVSSVLLLRLRGGGGEGGGLSGPVLITALTVAPLLAIILLGEVLPKLIAARVSAAWARAIAIPMLLVHRGLTPVRVAASVAVIGPLARLIAPRQTPPALDADELESMLRLSQKRGVIDVNEEQLLRQVLALGEVRVRDLMVPRVDIEAHEVTQPVDRLIERIRETKLRFVPLYEGDLDTVVGVAEAKRMLLRRPDSPEAARAAAWPPRFVPEQARADQLLAEFRETGGTFAIVVDEFGGTAGLITLEDLVEQMVGEIPGVYETNEEPEIEPLGPGRWRVDADLSVHSWPEVLGGARLRRLRDAGAALSAVHTVGGLVMARLGRVPVEGDTVRLGNLRITVRSVTGARIDDVTIETGRAAQARASGGDSEGAAP